MLTIQIEIFLKHRQKPGNLADVDFCHCILDESDFAINQNLFE